MELAHRKAEQKWPIEILPSGGFSKGLFVPIDHLLACGGDQRLSLAPNSRQNMYGCTPYPRPELVDFASSTASCISEEAYARVLRSREEYLATATSEGAEYAFKKTIAIARERLLSLLDLEDTDTKVVFSASGTDAQIQALFLAKCLLGTPLTTIIVGADQTGSGTAYTSRGHHFSHITAAGHEVLKDQPIPELSDGVRNINVPFRQPGAFRTPAEMDRAVVEAVEFSISNGSKVVLQTMDASKFGWRAPSDACVEQIVRRWPDQVQVIVDACQLRSPEGRLRDLLAKGFAVLVTGSKFFTGPAFSGALLVPAKRFADAIAITPVPSGLLAYGSAYDWPEEWESLRAQFPAKANFGQWLRWEAALEEMRLFNLVPAHFRDFAQDALAIHIARLVELYPSLRLLSYGNDQVTPSTRPTMFPVSLHRKGAPLSATQAAAVYQAMNCDLSIIASNDTVNVDRSILRIPCQTGQPVMLSEREGAALRVSLSARTIRQCWSDKPEIAEARINRMRKQIETLFAKLHFVIQNVENIEAKSQ